MRSPRPHDAELCVSEVALHRRRAALDGAGGAANGPGTSSGRRADALRAAQWFLRLVYERPYSRLGTTLDLSCPKPLACFGFAAAWMSNDEQPSTT